MIRGYKIMTKNYIDGCRMLDNGYIDMDCRHDNDLDSFKGKYDGGYIRNILLGDKENGYNLFDINCITCDMEYAGCDAFYDLGVGYNMTPDIDNDYDGSESPYISYFDMSEDRDFYEFSVALARVCDSRGTAFTCSISRDDAVMTLGRAFVGYSIIKYFDVHPYSKICFCTDEFVNHTAGDAMEDLEALAYNFSDCCMSLDADYYRHILGWIEANRSSLVALFIDSLIGSKLESAFDC